MKYKQLEVDDVTVVKIEETHFNSIYSETFRKLMKSLKNDSKIKVVIDIGNIEYIDSSGLGAFLFALKGMREKGGDIHFVDFQPAVKTLIETAYLDTFFKDYKTVEEGVHSF